MRHINAFTHEDDARKWRDENSKDDGPYKLEVVSVGDPKGPGLVGLHDLYIVMPSAGFDALQSVCKEFIESLGDK